VAYQGKELEKKGAGGAKKKIWRKFTIGPLPEFLEKETSLGEHEACYKPPLG